MGTVATVGDLPPSADVGDGYVVTAQSNDVYVWDGSSWNSIGPVQGPQGATGATGPQGVQGPLRSSYAKHYLQNESTVNNSTAWRSFAVLEPTAAIESGGYTDGATYGGGAVGSGAGGIIVPSNGVYQVYTTAYFEVNASNGPQRPAVAVRFAVSNVDGQQGTIIYDEVGASAYIRRASGHNRASTSLSSIIEMTQGQQVQIQFKRDATSGTVNLLGAESMIYITKIAD